MYTFSFKFWYTTYSYMLSAMNLDAYRGKDSISKSFELCASMQRLRVAHLRVEVQRGEGGLHIRVDQVCSIDLDVDEPRRHVF